MYEYGATRIIGDTSSEVLTYNPESVGYFPLNIDH